MPLYEKYSRARARMFYFFSAKAPLGALIICLNYVRTKKSGTGTGTEPSFFHALFYQIAFFEP